MNLLKIKHNLVLQVLLNEFKIGDGHSKNTCQVKVLVNSRYPCMYKNIFFELSGIQTHRQTHRQTDRQRHRHTDGHK